MIDLLRTRRSVRRFAPTPVTAEQVETLLKCAMSAPSAGNEQAWQFVVMDDPQVWEAYLQVNRNTPRGAPMGILVCGDLQAQKYEGYWVQDCSAAVQNLLLAAHAQGLGAVWTTVFPNGVAPIRQLLGLPEHVIPFACVPVGHPKEAPRAEDRYKADRVHRNRW